MTRAAAKAEHWAEHRVPYRYEAEGATGLLRGVPATFSKQLPYTATKQVTFDALIDLAAKVSPALPRWASTAAAAASAAVLSTLASQPGCASEGEPTCLPPATSHLSRVAMTITASEPIGRQRCDPLGGEQRRQRQHPLGCRGARRGRPHPRAAGTPPAGRHHRHRAARPIRHTEACLWRALNLHAVIRPTQEDAALTAVSANYTNAMLTLAHSTHMGQLLRIGVDRRHAQQPHTSRTRSQSHNAYPIT